MTQLGSTHDANQWSLQDREYMARAIRLARQGLYTTDPNPRVGCVIVKDGEVLAEGWHQRAGEGHAEVNALAEAGVAAQGATAYVTLEPCSHIGKTPPCANALLKAGVSKVFAAMQDPNPLVAGQGLARLADAGVEVSCGLLEAQARELNPGFIKRMTTGRPLVRLKSAISVDGATAMASGESQWITGPAARSDVQRWRARSSAVISGIDTVIEDNAALNVRAAELGIDCDQDMIRQPLRVVLDTNARLGAQARILAAPGKVLWMITASSKPDPQVIGHPSVEVVYLPDSYRDSRDLCLVLDALAERGCNELWVEAGATLTGAFIAQALWDEMLVYMAPKLMGSNVRSLAVLPYLRMAEAQDLAWQDVRMVGNDLRLHLTREQKS